MLLHSLEMYNWINILKNPIQTCNLQTSDKNCMENCGHSHWQWSLDLFNNHLKYLEFKIVSNEYHRMKIYSKRFCRTLWQACNVTKVVTIIGQLEAVRVGVMHCAFTCTHILIPMVQESCQICQEYWIGL